MGGDSRFAREPSPIPERRAPPLDIQSRIMVTVSDKATSDAAMFAHGERLSDAGGMEACRGRLVSSARPVLGYAGWRYSFGHSPRSFSAAVTSNPAAGVIANPGGFGFFL